MRAVKELKSHSRAEDDILPHSFGITFERRDINKSRCKSIYKFCHKGRKKNILNAVCRGRCMRRYNTIQNNTIRYNTIQNNTIRYNTIQNNTIQHNTIQYSITQYNTIQNNTTQYNTVQHNTIQYNTVQHNTMQHNTMQYIKIQYCRISTLHREHRITDNLSSLR